MSDASKAEKQIDMRGLEHSCEGFVLNLSIQHPVGVDSLALASVTLVV